MYLTRMYLNTRRSGAQRLLASPQRMHAAVESGIPPGRHLASRTLWRVDTGTNATTLFIVSSSEPDLSHIAEQAGWRTGEVWQTLKYAPLLDSLAAGQRWAYRLTANPTRREKVGGRADASRRVAHTTVEAQQQWLSQRSVAAGFRVGPAESEDALSITGRRALRFQRRGCPVTVSAVTFEGVLTVLDPHRLRSTLVDGIGAAKAYGCGLLTLASVGGSG